MPNATPRRYATLDAAANHVGVHKETIRRWIKDGRITAYRLSSKSVRVDLAELDRLGENDERVPDPELAEAKIAAYIEKVLEQAPPLTDEQRTRLAELLRPARVGGAA